MPDLRRRFSQFVLVFGALVAWGLVSTSGAAAVVIYSEDFSGSNGTQPDGFNPVSSPGYAQYANVKGQIVSNEYEQRKTGVHSNPDVDDDARTVNYYENADDIDQASWRDTTVSTILRFSGHPLNQPGLIFRARDVVRGSGNLINGYFYSAQISGDKLELYRFSNNDAGNDGPAALTSVDLGTYSSTANRLMKVTVSNVPHPNQDRVQIDVQLYAGTSEVSGVWKTLSYTDTSPDAITRGGGVGFRTINSGDAGPRAVFDNLTVSNNNESLLWYDDFFDGRALRMSDFSAGMYGGTMNVTIYNEKYAFTGTGPAVGAAVVDFPEVTQKSSWENVEASTLMRIGYDISDLYGGLLIRGQDINLTTGEGDFYTMLLTGPNGSDPAELGIYRVSDQVDEMLAGVDVSSINLASTNIYVKFSSQTLSDGNVHLWGLASLNSDFSDPFATVSVVDDAAERLLGPGTAGLLVQNQSMAQYAANFDNFTVNAIPEPSTLAMLLGLGAVGLLGYLRRRRKS